MTATVATDLLNDMVLVVAHGGRHNRIGAVRTYVLPDLGALVALLRQLDRRRLQHGYQRLRTGTAVDSSWNLATGS